MTEQKELEAALAKAETALADAVINSTKVDADRVEANGTRGATEGMTSS